MAFICEVCGNEPGLGVACIPGMPMSVAYGRTCLENNAHPSWAMRAQVEMAGGVNEVIPEFLDSVVYEAGQYITLRASFEKNPPDMKWVDDYHRDIEGEPRE
jgi:hypothetical protein